MTGMLAVKALTDLQDTLSAILMVTTGGHGWKSEWQQNWHPTFGNHSHVVLFLGFSEANDSVPAMSSRLGSASLRLTPKYTF